MATREQISVQAHNRKMHAECDRLLRQIDSSREKILREVQRFEEKLLDDPIRVGKMRYSETEGFTGEPFQIESESFTFAFNFLASSTKNDQVNFEPRIHSAESAKVRPHGLLIAPFGTFLPLTIENFELSYRIVLNWVRERSAQESKVCIIDRDSGEYYYPIDTDLRGEVIAGYPKVGMIAFEPFRRPTTAVSIHFSGIKLSPKRSDTSTFDFEYRSPDLAEQVRSNLGVHGLLERAQAELDRLVVESKATIEQRRQAWLKPIPQSGCLVGLILIPVATAIGALLVAFLVPLLH